jgi:CheY-like chemotaxis protein
MKVLVVDDSPPFRERVKRHLNEADGIVVVGEAGDGLAALREVERLLPDVVLLDLHMPGIDGFHVLQHVKDRFACTTVIVLTSDASEMVRQRCAVLRADAVIDKRDVAAGLLPALRQLSASRLV